jgi:hypothetical protein
LIRHARRRVWPATAVAVALLGAACGGGNGGGDDPGAASASSTSDAGSATAAGTPSDAEHTVESPGELDTRLVGDDMLVVGQDTLPEDLIERIKRIRVKGEKAVDATEVLSIGQISAENELYDVAAVDLPAYRMFTVAKTANFQEQWDRLAGGEFAADEELDGQLPLDGDDYLAAGSGEDVHLIHAGAYAPQAGDLDIVVNTAWGETLGLPADNALLISTGAVSPQAARKPLKKLLGEDYSIQNLDVVKEYGLDRNAKLVAQPVGTFGDAVGTFRYRPIGGGRIAPDPAWVAEHIVTDTVPILGRVTCNKHMMPQFKAALREIVETGLADEIHPEQYAGCYYPRFIAGSNKLSNHSFGLAVDLNVPGNQRGTVGEIHRGVVDIFKRWGFAWGGDWNYTDPMHFELARIVEPG